MHTFGLCPPLPSFECHNIPNRFRRSAICASSFNSACSSLPLATVAARARIRCVAQYRASPVPFTSQIFRNQLLLWIFQAPASIDKKETRSKLSIVDADVGRMYYEHRCTDRYYSGKR